MYCIVNSVASHMFWPLIVAIFKVLTVGYSVQHNQQAHHHHLHLDGIPIHKAYQHATQHKLFYQYYIF